MQSNMYFKESNLSLNEVDHIVFFEKPFLKFERLLEPIWHLLQKVLNHSVYLCQYGLEKNFFKKIFV